MTNAHAYLFLNIAVMSTVVTLTWGRPEWRCIVSRRWAVRAAMLFVFWSLVDVIAVRLRLWNFPQGGTLGLRALNLPFEEYLVFVVHAVLTTMVTSVARR